MNVFLAASLGNTITDTVSEVAKALRYPVLILALLALALVTYEIGRLGVEALRRSQRSKEPFDILARRVMEFARAGDSAGAQAIIREYAYGNALQAAAVGTMFAANPVDAQRAVVDYDLYVSKRLDRVRLLVRAGPALGLMGTLIPLSPALAALGKGNSKVLADELQTAFAITVVGVMIGLIAFSVALIRERYYTKDLADLEFLREIRGDAIAVSPASVPQPSAATPAHATVADQPSAETVATSGAQPAAVAASAAGSLPQPAATAPQPGEPASFTATPPVAASQPAASAPAGGKKKKKFGISRKSSAASAAAQAAPAAAPASAATPAPATASQAFPPPPPAPVPPAQAGEPQNGETKNEES